MPVVRLSQTEYSVVWGLADRRRGIAVARGSYNSHGAVTNGGNSLDLIGAAGECCVAKYVTDVLRYPGCFWCGGHEERGKQFPDVGRYFVRTTERKPNNISLILHPGEYDERVVILVLPILDDELAYDVTGWLYGHDAPKVGHFEKDWNGRKDNDVWLVKPNQLYAIEYLPRPDDAWIPTPNPSRKAYSNGRRTAAV